MLNSIFLSPSAQHSRKSLNKLTSSKLTTAVGALKSPGKFGVADPKAKVETNKIGRVMAQVVSPKRSKLIASRAKKLFHRPRTAYRLCHRLSFVTTMEKRKRFDRRRMIECARAWADGRPMHKKRREEVHALTSSAGKMHALYLGTNHYSCV